MDEFTNLLGRNGFLPHGTCFAWQPTLLWTMVGADLTVALAYFSIPVALLYYMRRRPDVATRGVMALFSAFIFSCGLTHLADVWTVWRPDYALQAGTKAITAVISATSAAALWWLMPRALAIPSVQQLQGMVQRLEAEAAQRRSAEEHLADAEQNLAATLASIGAGFVATDRGGRVTRINEVAEALLGWPAAQALGRSSFEVIEREGRTEGERSSNPVDLLLQRGLGTGAVQHIVVRSRDGRRVPLELKAALTHDEAGQVRGMAVLLRDRTAVLAAEETSARLAAIVASSSDAIVSKTLDGRITSWNRGAEAMFGYAADEMVGRPVAVLIPPEREAEEQQILQRLARGESVPPFETQRLARGGRRLDVSVSVSPLRDAEGRLVGASKIARDISPLKQAEQARQAAQRLEAENRQMLEAGRLKNQFLATMSHELRTPLNAVIGFADLLHMGRVDPASPKHHEYLGHIAQSGRHLLQLINDVLDLAKVESGRLDFSPQAVLLPQLVADVVAVQQATAAAKGIRVETEVDPGLGPLHLDPLRLKQALFNYLSNAIKFTPAGGRVQVRGLAEGPERFRLEVQDNGVGIAERDLPRLFVEFQQLDAGLDKRHQGTGLGLALTRRLVQAQGGEVGVKSRLGEGSVFHLVLDRVVALPPGRGA